MSAAPAAKKTPIYGDPRDMLIGAVLQSMEALTLGMPFEVWKTQQISGLAKLQYKNSWKELQNLAAGGIGRFYAGSSAKLVEAGSKGAILLWGTNMTLSYLHLVGIDRYSAVGGMLGGFFGGIMQTVVMSPMTYIVTYKNRNPSAAGKSMITIARESGFKTLYGSAPSMAGRQGTNWALRWFFAQAINNKMVERKKGAKLNKGEQILAGVLGGACGCINQPFEVVRVLQQAQVAMGTKGVTTRSCAKFIYDNYGLKGFYGGLIPRMALSAWQTMFMVTFAGMAKELINKK